MPASACRHDRAGKIIRALSAACVVAPLICACTVVKVTAPDGAVQIHRVAGVAKIVLDDSHGPVVVHERGVGLTGSAMGWTLGYAQHEFALPGDGCAAVFWVTSRAEGEALQALADELPNVCLIASY